MVATGENDDMVDDMVNDDMVNLIFTTIISYFTNLPSHKLPSHNLPSHITYHPHLIAGTLSAVVGLVKKWCNPKISVISVFI